MVGDRMRRRARIAEDMHRQMPDRARDPAAIQVEGGEVRGADILGRIHFHTVDNSVEVIAAQPIALDRLDECSGDELLRTAGIELVDLAMPCG